MYLVVLCTALNCSAPRRDCLSAVGRTIRAGPEGAYAALVQQGSPPWRSGAQRTALSEGQSRVGPRVRTTGDLEVCTHFTKKNEK